METVANWGAHTGLKKAAGPQLQSRIASWQTIQGRRTFPFFEEDMVIWIKSVFLSVSKHFFNGSILQAKRNLSVSLS